MSLTPKPKRKPYRVKWLSSAQEINMKSYLQGHVYCWCKNRSDEWFALRNLVGGENDEWKNSPLYPLYQRHEGKKMQMQKFQTRNGSTNRFRWIK